MVKNLSESLAKQDRGDRSLDANNNTYVTSVMALISTMKEICEVCYTTVHLLSSTHMRALQGLELGTVVRANYIPFCKQISDILARYPMVLNHHRLTTLVAWLRDIS